MKHMKMAVMAACAMILLFISPRAVFAAGIGETVSQETVKELQAFDYERLFIRDPEVKAREGKMAYVRPEYHERIMRITRVIGHDRLTLSAYIDHVLTHHFNQCEDAIKSLYARNYNSVF